MNRRKSKHPEYHAVLKVTVLPDLHMGQTGTARASLSEPYMWFKPHGFENEFLCRADRLLLGQEVKGMR